ncbi:MAG: 16S rRNA (cytidine(1402)-2'-O)-methyltransferase [Desulfobacterales bacterium]|nr:16S rRNA (cytidine(1402)-2'-O)-methyltransferase [Desulfobacterales bacterium]
MPLNLPINNFAENPPGRLYVVGTPIGNRSDITLRALETLKIVDLIAAEDTRHTARLLIHYGIRTPLISYHDFNEKERSAQLLTRLRQGASVALVSNAGTPSVSDPGYALIAAAIAGNIPIVPIPGPSAIITALCAAGLPTDTFVFSGFPARKKGKRLEALKALCREERTIIFYESPRRLLAFLEELLAVFGDRTAVLSRELTKIHEEFIRGRLSEILFTLKQRAVIKGECTLLVAGCKAEAGAVSDLVQQELQQKLKTGQRRLSDIAKEMALKYKVSKNEIYKEALKLKGT